VPNPRRNLGPPSVPASAATFSLELCYEEIVDGRPKKRRKRMKGEPNTKGEVPVAWPAHEFSVENVLQAFGPGRYRVDFYDATGEHVPDSGRIFEAAVPARPDGPRFRKRRRELADDAADEAPARRRDANAPITAMDLILMQQQQAAEREQREERLAERHRSEMVAQSERDRQFMIQFAQMLNGRAAGAPPDADLLRRELSLEIREGMSRVRRELRDLEPDEPDPDPGPRDLDDAQDRIGRKILAELEERAPDIMHEAVPALVGYLRTKGVRFSPELETAIAQQQQQRATNGKA